MEVVSRYVQTLTPPFFAAATVATLSPVMEGLVRTIMSVRLAQITASNDVSIRLVGSDVPATLDSNLTLIRELVLVSFYCVVNT